MISLNQILEPLVFPVDPQAGFATSVGNGALLRSNPSATGANVLTPAITVSGTCGSRPQLLLPELARHGMTSSTPYHAAAPLRKSRSGSAGGVQAGVEAASAAPSCEARRSASSSDGRSRHPAGTSAPPSSPTSKGSAVPSSAFTLRDLLAGPCPPGAAAVHCNSRRNVVSFYDMRRSEGGLSSAEGKSSATSPSGEPTGRGLVSSKSELGGLKALAAKWGPGPAAVPVGMKAEFAPQAPSGLAAGEGAPGKRAAPPKPARSCPPSPAPSVYRGEPGADPVLEEGPAVEAYIDVERCGTPSPVFGKATSFSGSLPRPSHLPVVPQSLFAPGPDAGKKRPRQMPPPLMEDCQGEVMLASAEVKVSPPGKRCSPLPEPELGPVAAKLSLRSPGPSDKRQLGDGVVPPLTVVVKGGRHGIKQKQP